MRISSPKASCAALCLVVYLALSTISAAFAAGTGEAESLAVEVFRANLLTPDEERIVGERLAYLYEQRHALLKDAAAEARLGRIRERLRAVIPAQQPLEIKIIKGSEVEAVSFPGGRIYLSSALLKVASTDDELAAVIAHEAAHVAGRHFARLVALALALPSEERERFPTRRAIITGRALQFAFPSRLERARLRCEMEADEMAARWLESAGYDSSALALLLEGINARRAGTVRTQGAALEARIALLKGSVVIK